MSADKQAAAPIVAGPYGVWLTARTLRQDPAELRRLAAEVEGLGYSALWLGGSLGADLSGPAELLAGSSRLVVGTSVVNIWRDPAEEVAVSATNLADTYGARFILGLGPGHASQVELHHDRYARPLAALGEFLDVLDAGQPPVHRRLLAALGPKALALAAQRSAGALPFLTTPEHTRSAREIVGAGAFLAPEQKLVLVADPDRARELARGALKYYLELPNYVNSWRRLGLAESDFEGDGSDRLIDALVGWGAPETAVERAREHLAAGADHVCIQPVPAEDSDLLTDLQTIATKLF
ncbi:MAG TPA: TIGR03620 family F420-dependent LLM class oxidoreductase [Kineosporiaceae bacterium]|nr:TIGR03620 family F420-dependent LLM class oxidoreductase [Kineosporiaceae bacterium]